MENGTFITSSCTSILTTCPSEPFFLLQHHDTLFSVLYPKWDHWLLVRKTTGLRKKTFWPSWGDLRCIPTVIQVAQKRAALEQERLERQMALQRAMVRPNFGVNPGTCEWWSLLHCSANIMPTQEHLRVEAPRDLARLHKARLFFPSKIGSFELQVSCFNGVSWCFIQVEYESAWLVDPKPPRFVATTLWPMRVLMPNHPDALGARTARCWSICRSSGVRHSRVTWSRVQMAMWQAHSEGLQRAWHIDFTKDNLKCKFEVRFRLRCVRPAAGFDENRLMADARYKLSAALQAAGLFSTKAGQEALARVVAPKPAQPHMVSQAGKKGWLGALWGWLP